MGNGISHFAENIGNSITSGFKAVPDALHGLGGGGFGDFKNDLQNQWGTYLNRAFTGSNDFSVHQSQDSINQQKLQEFTNPNTYYNASNWQSATSHLSNAAYGPQAGMSGVVKPTDLMSISDPTTKYLNSSLRGTQKTMYQGLNNTFNTNSSSTLSMANNPSQSINSGGGTGPPISQDLKTNSGMSVSNSVSSGGSVGASSSTGQGTPNQAVSQLQTMSK